MPAGVIAVILLANLIGVALCRAAREGDQQLAASRQTARDRHDDDAERTPQHRGLAPEAASPPVRR